LSWSGYRTERERGSKEVATKKKIEEVDRGGREREKKRE
jgi:hypothetical protein